jgi:hypothetical protein
MRPSELAHDRQAVAIRQPPASAIPIRAAQRLGHQRDRIETILRTLGAVVDLPDADDHRGSFRVHAGSLPIDYPRDTRGQSKRKGEGLA